MKNINTKLNKLRPSVRRVQKSASPAAKTLTFSDLNPLLKSMALGNPNAKTVTANGAITPATSGDKVLDFFFQAGALRGKTDAQVLDVFKKAIIENRGLALKALFYIRDVRSGQGERKTFRTCLKHLAQNHSALVVSNLENIPFYGRFDDLLELFGTSVEKDMMTFVNNQLFADLSTETPSLLAKWLPSENASSKEGRNQAIKFAKFMSLSSRNYRRILSHLRGKIKIVETAMCNKDWSSIPYDKIPSRAGFVYRKAFGRNDKERYASFLTKAEKGEVKINTATLYPYDIARQLMRGNADKTLEVAWNNLPNYFEGVEPKNRLVVVDTSGSMSMGMAEVKPIEISVSLGLYIAERNTGPFKDWLISFSMTPKLLQVQGSSVAQKFAYIQRECEGYNTDLQAVFNLILNHAVSNNIKEKDMPKELYLISDMQFDSACSSNNLSNFEVVKKKYKAAGFKVPKVIFWNVNATPNQSPVRKDEINTILVSGCSPTILKNILGDKNETPYDFMLEVLNSERYNRVKF